MFLQDIEFYWNHLYADNSLKLLPATVIDAYGMDPFSNMNYLQTFEPFVSSKVSMRFYL